MTFTLPIRLTLPRCLIGTKGQQAARKNCFLEGPGSSMDRIIADHPRVVDRLANIYRTQPFGLI